LIREQAEIIHKGRRYTVPVSEINGKPGLLKFPDGSLVDRTRLLLVDEYGEKFKLFGRIPASGGDNIGPLPYMPIINVQET
jgi:hypothetical protein